MTLPAASQTRITASCDQLRNFAYATASAGSRYHSRPNGSASEIRSKPGLSLRGRISKRAFLVSHRVRRKIQNTTFFKMRSFLTYLSERCKWASKGTGAVCGWVSLLVGATLAVLLWFYPRWFHDHISDRMNACVLVMVPLLAGASVFLVRWFVSPYPIYMQVRRTLDTLTDTKKEERVKAVNGCFERSAAILKQHPSVLLSFHALSRAEGHRLESNQEVAEVCDLIQEAGYDHPFEGISPGYVPEKDWLPFLKYVRHAPSINPEEGKDYLDAADRWRQDHGYPLPTDDADFVSLVERTLLR
jgi:hypothetical protein